MKKLLLSLIVLGVLLGCSNVNADTNKPKFDAKEVARIQEIDRLRGKALTEKLTKKNVNKEKDKVKEKVKSETVNKSDNETSSNGASDNTNSAPNTSNDVVNNGGSNNTQTPPSNNNGGSNNTQTPPTTPPSNNNGSNNTQKPPTTPPVQPPEQPQELKPVTALGNSGELFETRNQALNWGLEIIEDFDLSIEWSDALGFNVVGFSTVGVKMNNGQEWYSVEFY